MGSLRHRTAITFPHTALARPRGVVRRFTVAPPGVPELDALACVVGDGSAQTWHFVGFNTVLGPWEAAKCALWATRTATSVVMCELPGLTRRGDPLPAPVRRDLLDADPTSWALLTADYLAAAARAAGLAEPAGLDILGFSTGCALAAAALPALRATHPVTSLTLVEPVSLTSRPLGRLAADNIVDALRVVRTVPGNLSNQWVRRTALRQVGEHGVTIAGADFAALSVMLASDHTARRLAQIDLPVTHLVRGAQSRLSRSADFEALDARLEERGVPGTTGVVTGLGHQLWHSLPAVDAVVRALHPARDRVIAGKVG
jgi:alpha-beta hydrolase superfamily lysophospholipase